jgi:DNA uptake protein and related DNA-binding proteins
VPPPPAPPRPQAPRPPRPQDPRYFPGPPQPGPGYTPPPPSSHPNTGISVLWALAPLFSCGFATPFTIGYGAARIKSRSLAIAAVIYGLGMLFFWFGASDVGGPAVEALSALGFLGNWIGGTAHSFAIRNKVFDLPHGGPLSPNERAIAEAQHRRNLRQEARELAKKDPALAKELRIGRPDLPRQYDDGGLVDINHAPAEVIARLPGMTPELAQKIVEVRETVGPFVSAEEVSATVGLPPQITSDLAEYTIYLS